MLSGGDQNILSSHGQLRKDQELEQKKIIFNKYVKGKGNKKKEDAKLELE